MNILYHATKLLKRADLDGAEVLVEQQVRFDLSPEIIDVEQPYSMVYGYHPSLIVFTGPIGDCSFTMCPAGADPYTGRHTDITYHRRSPRMFKPRSERILQHVIEEGASLEVSNAETYNKYTPVITT